MRGQKKDRIGKAFNKREKQRDKENVVKLYQIKTRIIGKDLDETVTIGFIVAESDEAVYDHIDEKHQYGGWAESVHLTREEIIAAKGDFGTKYMGEFFDQKFGWEELGEVTPEEIATLRRLGVLAAA